MLRNNENIEICVESSPLLNSNIISSEEETNQKGRVQDFDIELPLTQLSLFEIGKKQLRELKDEWKDDCLELTKCEIACRVALSSVTLLGGCLAILFIIAIVADSVFDDNHCLICPK